MRLVPNACRPGRAHPTRRGARGRAAGYRGGGRSGRRGAEGGADTDGVLPADAKGRALQHALRPCAGAQCVCAKQPGC